MKFKNYLPDWLYRNVLAFYNRFINPFYQKSYAQEGEDLIFYRLIYGKLERGFYVDVGAHHPKRFSNTYFFYKKGWRGINIEPMPGSKKLFDKYRPKDINIESPISLVEEELTYYMFNEPALNGFIKDIRAIKNQTGNYKVLRTVNLKTKTLKKLFDEYLPSDKKINLLSVDVEGMDLAVLQSNDWKKYLPDYVMVEDRDFDFLSPTKSDIYNYLTNLDYSLIVKTVNTLIFSLK
jgi:FkbM family methyltransferase